MVRYVGTLNPINNWHYALSLHALRVAMAFREWQAVRAPRLPLQWSMAGSMVYGPIDNQSFIASEEYPKSKEYK